MPSNHPVRALTEHTQVRARQNGGPASPAHRPTVCTRVCTRTGRSVGNCAVHGEYTACSAEAEGLRLHTTRLAYIQMYLHCSPPCGPKRRIGVACCRGCTALSNCGTSAVPTGVPSPPHVHPPPRDDGSPPPRGEPSPSDGSPPGGGGTVHHSRPANSGITQLKIFFSAFGACDFLLISYCSWAK